LQDTQERSLLEAGSEASIWVPMSRLFFLGFVGLVFPPVENRADRQDGTIHQEKPPEVIGGLPHCKIGRPGQENQKLGIHARGIGLPPAIL
jgi:hypothetical protein